MGRLRFGLMAVAMLVATAGAALAQTQGYPNRPIRVLVGFPPGGAADIIARLIGQSLSARLGQPIVIENRPGSGSNLAGDLAAKSAPDGYTLLHTPENLLVINPHAYAKLPFDPLKDLVPITSLISNQYALAVHPSVPANNLREFVELAQRTNPPLFYASIGNGSPHHLMMELLKQHTKIDLTHVPYRGGGPAANAMLAGEVSAMFGAASIAPTIQSGRFRGLAVSGKSRWAPLPDLPTIDEIYPGYEMSVWHAWFAPAGTPEAIRDRLRREINEVLREPELVDRLLKSGSGDPYISTPEEFQARVRSDYDKLGKVIKSLGLRIE
jgi:tripartite-type tricarboxylate transporter receptor subunit TctC